MLVLLFHSTNPFSPAEIDRSYVLRFFTTGWNGVTLFFVLSGFLIGNLALRELQRSGEIRLREFWIRRMLRTWPLYFFMLFVAYWSQDGRTVQPAFWHYLTFTQNFFDVRFFVQTWTLAVEEQFYFVLPMMLIVMARGGRVVWLPAVAVAGIVVAAFARVMLLSTNTLSVMDGLLVGVLIAFTRLHRPEMLEPLIAHSNLTMIGGLLVVYAPYVFPETSFARTIIGGLGGAVGFGLLLIAALGRNAVSWLLESRAAFFVALVSYSVYLSHGFILLMVQRLATGLSLVGHSRLLFVVLVGLPTACLAGAVLYVVVERPFLILRERVAHR